jgi:putative ABC transport system permease protein
MLNELWSDLRFRWRAIVRRGRVERELDEELQYHIDRETEKYRRSGIEPDEARRRALLALGGVNRVKDHTRDVRGTVLWDATVQDLRCAVRGLIAKPMFSAGVILTLGLGIGANAVMFGIVDRLLFRTPAYMADVSRVHRVYFSWWRDGSNVVARNTQFARYQDVARLTRSFSHVSAFQTREIAVGRGADTRNMLVNAVSGNYFDFFDARPVIGRFLTPDDDRVPSGSPVTVITYAFWQTNYAADPRVLGTTLQLGNANCAIVGVAPPDFIGLGDEGVPMAFMPITLYASSMRGTNYPPNYAWSWLELMVRRRPDVDVDAASTDLSNAFRQSWIAQVEALPGTPKPDAARPSAILAPVQLERGPQASINARVATWVAGVALIVLLIACTNVANLLLARAIARRREIAVRLALGVSKSRLGRQFLTETLVLSALGCAAGLAVAQWGGGVLRALFFSAAHDASVLGDRRTLFYSMAIALATAVVTGIAPIVQARRQDLTTTLKSGGYQGTHRPSRARIALLIVQTALSVVLLIGTGLFVRSVYNVGAMRLGYDVDPVLHIAEDLRTTRLTGLEESALTDRLIRSAREIPGVTGVTPAVTIPFWSNEGRALFVAGIDNVRALGVFLLQTGSPEYFATTGTRILRGRGFTDDDRATSMPVAVVTESMARLLWAGHDALGQCLRIGAMTAPCTSIIGIAEDVRLRSIVDEREFTYFIPVAQYDGTPTDFFVRVEGNARDYTDAVRRRLQMEMPGEAFVTVRPLSALIAPTRRAWEFGATMFVAFGALALILAGIGLYSVMAYDVAQRAKEVGVRIALGASAPQLVWLIVGQSARIVLYGILIGTAIALIASRSIGALLFNVSPRDPAIFAWVALVLLAVAFAATAVPAVTAATTNPTEALRVE